MVSVIIPIFNVIRYIDRGMHNILAQRYQDFEIILSDDGSTDGSYEECMSWAKNDSRIRVLHQSNKGAGAARNHGIEEAKGDYIYFFDIDDEIRPNLLQYCVDKMESLGCDFICFGYENVETTYKSKTIVTFQESIITNNESFKNQFVDQFVLKVNGFPWNKFYRKSFLDKYNLRYEDQRIQQDEVFNLKCYRYIEKAFLSSEVLYTYYIYEKGNTRSRFIPERFEIYKSVRLHFDTLSKFWDLRDSRLDNYLKSRFYNGVLQCMLFNMCHPQCTWSTKNKKAEMRKIMSDALTQEAFSYAISTYSDLENKVYQYVCQSQSLCLIRLSTSFFNFFHHLMKFLRRYQ